MKKLLFNIFIFIGSISSMILLGFYNSNYSFWEYYFFYHLDLFISLIVLSLSTFLQILDYEGRIIDGKWSVHVFPEDWNGRDVATVADGTLILVSAVKKVYHGYLILDWKDKNSDTLVSGLYEIEFKREFRAKVSGRSLMILRAEHNNSFTNDDNAKGSYCYYNLRLIDSGTKMEGRLTMKNGVSSLMYAIKD